MSEKNIKKSQQFMAPPQQAAPPVANNIPLASNPATAQGLGLTNMQLTPGTPGANVPGKTSTDELENALRAVINSNDEGDFRALAPIFAKMASELQSPDYVMALRTLVAKLQFESGQQSINPQTNAPVAGPKELAAQLLKTIQLQKNLSTQNTQPQARPLSIQPLPSAQAQGIQGRAPQANPAVPTASPRYNNPSEIAQSMQGILQNMSQQRTSQIIKKKKKTRGNPFKVLMGKVGKLLDHGLSKNQIARYLSKQKYWNKDTIEKAIDIVKDYNKKKHKKAVYDIKRIILAEVKEIGELQVNYEVISTADLLMRKEFLQGCVDGTELGAQPPTPRKELGVVNRILKERGLKE